MLAKSTSTDASQSDEENHRVLFELLGAEEEKVDAKEESRRSKRSPGLSEKFGREVANLKE